MPDVRIVHATFDALPRVVTGDPHDPGVELRVPFRVEHDPAARIVSWELEVTVGGTPRAGVEAHRVTPELVAELRERMAAPGQFDVEHVPPYLDMADRMGPGVTYLEGRVPGLTEGASVTYALQVSARLGTSGPTVARSGDFTTWAVLPAFGPGDVLATHIPAPGRAMEAWVLHHKRVAALDLVRVDVVALEADPATVPADLLDLVVTIGTRTVDLRALDPAALPLVSTAADSVIIAVPVDGDAVPAMAVTCRGTAPVAVDPAAPAGRTRVAFVNFAIQGLNDYFASPDTGYDPPRTYAQVTMRDESATFSSRPGSREDHTGDGYAFTLDAHRRYGIRQMWAMNGGLLDLLAHDCPDDVAAMRKDVADGLMVPVVAGFGAHRLPYYSAATNHDAITWGARVMDEILGGHSPVYYPDSRIVTAHDNVAEALIGAGVQYLVVDAGQTEGSADSSTVVADVVPPMGVTSGGRWLDWQYVWCDRRTGIKVLFIDPEMKDGLYGASDRDAARGKVSLDMRRKFMELAAQPVLRRDNLLVYSDDADKASGNGWFDGVYDGSAVPYNRLYQAALSWIHAHPWVQAVTTDDLTAADCVGELDLVSACDPWITRHWRLPGVPVDPDLGLAFDTWVTMWREVRSAWLGETLGAVSDRAERALAARPPSNRLDELARLYFTLCLHESQWSKRARQGDGDDPALFTGPEDFVVAESLQLRNAHVFLDAAVWADWAATGPAPVSHRDDGPVIEQVAASEEQVDAAPPWRSPGAAGLHWDHDPLPTTILYNTEALVVVDLNGGRITHLFAMVDGHPCSLSGTFKAYQFLDVDWASEAGIKCDGIVLQNTVCTPNHAYVASDTAAAGGTIGAGAPDDTIFDWYYPDNFNAYRVTGGDDSSVTLVYEDGAHDDGVGDRTPVTLEQLDALLVEDRESRLAGGPGVVLHDTATFGAFRKTIRLEGRTVHVSYEGTRPGHVVANEFCVDLWAAAVRGQRQQPAVTGSTATVTNAAGLAVSVELGSGCAFSAATVAPADPPTTETLRLHRVMTDSLEVVASGGGAFDYRIVLP
jgi:hypothetical protein